MLWATRKLWTRYASGLLRRICYPKIKGRSPSVTWVRPSAYEAKLHATGERPQSMIVGRTPQGCRRSVFWEALTPARYSRVNRSNVRKFRKIPPFVRPVTEDQGFLVRSYTKIVTRDYKKMLS